MEIIGEKKVDMDGHGAEIPYIGGHGITGGVEGAEDETATVMVIIAPWEEEEGADTTWVDTPTWRGRWLGALPPCRFRRVSNGSGLTVEGREGRGQGDYDGYCYWYLEDGIDRRRLQSMEAGGEDFDDCQC